MAKRVLPANYRNPLPGEDPANMQMSMRKVILMMLGLAVISAAMTVLFPGRRSVMDVGGCRRWRKMLARTPREVSDPS